jgi:hypothetical protein
MNVLAAVQFMNRCTGSTVLRISVHLCGGTKPQIEEIERTKWIDGPNAMSYVSRPATVRCTAAGELRELG